MQLHNLPYKGMEGLVCALCTVDDHFAKIHLILSRPEGLLEENIYKIFQKFYYSYAPVLTSFNSTLIPM